MSPDREWLFRIEHILEDIERIRRYTAGLTGQSFADNTLIVDAVIRNFLVIGEAARKVPAEVRAAHPELPWAQTQAMRNILVHDYDAVRLDIVWNTIQASLPPIVDPSRNLAQQFRTLLKPMSPVRPTAPPAFCSMRPFEMTRGQAKPFADNLAEGPAHSCVHL